jgi:hypothetical protein
MDRHLITEIKRIKQLSSINESVIDENLLNDLKRFFSIATEKTLNRPEIAKLKELYDSLIAEPSEATEVKFNLENFDTDFYEKVLKCIGAPRTKNNLWFMLAWRQSEGGAAKYNPFNTKWKRPNSKDFQGGIQSYANMNDGVVATCNTLKQDNFREIREGFINDVGLRKLSEIVGKSVWGTDKKLLDTIVNDYLRGINPKPAPIAT